MKKMIAKIAIAIAIMMTMSLSQYAQAQTDLYMGKTEFSYVNNNYYIINNMGEYIIGNKTNTRIKGGFYTYTLENGERLKRVGINLDPTEICDNYDAKVKKICSEVFTKQEIAQFINNKRKLSYFSVLNFKGQIIETEVAIDYELKNVPFSKYYQMDNLLRNNLKFNIPQHYKELLSSVNCIIIDIYINFAEMYK